MITFKKTFDFYATDVELDVFINNIFDTIIDDPEADVEVYADSDTDHRYVTVNIPFVNLSIFLLFLLRLQFCNIFC
jgi:hypothetical protein